MVSDYHVEPSEEYLSVFVFGFGDIHLDLAE